MLRSTELVFRHRHDQLNDFLHGLFVIRTTLERVDTSRTTLERELTRELVERYRAEAAGDLTIEGPTLATTAFRLGRVDQEVPLLGG